MRIIIADTYYAKFLIHHYKLERALRKSQYSDQLSSLLRAGFGTSDSYSHNLNAMGCDTIDLIANCAPLQAAWAKDNGIPISALALKLPHQIYRVPLLGSLLARLPGLVDIAMAQIRALRPDVLYCQDIGFFPPRALRAIRSDVRLIVGQIACPLPPREFLEGYDLIMTSFPHLVPRLMSLGIPSAYFRIGFDARVLELLGNPPKNIDVSFVGGISRHHGNAIPLLEYVARKTPIKFYGYGAASLDSHSPIAKNHKGEVWALDMYRILARSRITLNRHINVAENNANNMRLYEATGVGTLLITDRKDNLGELFEVGKEVVAYSSKEEAAELINYYLEHPNEAEVIARAGQSRTLRDHTYERRMEELAPILERHLQGKRG